MLIPERESINKFPTQLTEGEWKLVDAYEMLDKELLKIGPGLDIYVQPYFENYRPDLVVRGPGNRVLIIEVKDRTWFNQNKKRNIQVVKSAVKQVSEYKSILQRLCDSTLEHSLESDRHNNPITNGNKHTGLFIETAIALPFTERCKVNANLYESTSAIFSNDLDSIDNLPKPKCPPTSPPEDEFFTECLGAALDSWLTPPYHRAEQGNLGITDLTREQRNHAKPRGKGWRRLAGPAGSGKSLVLAHKAAALASENKRVLVVCFNTTLTHYLRDLISRMRYGFSWENIVIRHFHGLLKEVRLHHCAKFENNEFKDDSFLRTIYPQFVSDLLKRNVSHPYKFDALLIDEGQDFHNDWMVTLKHCLNENAEVLLTRDIHQNIYGQDLSWCNADQSNEAVTQDKSEVTTGFRGKWARLNTTWRMGPNITRAVSEFAVRKLNATPFKDDPDRTTQIPLYPGSVFCCWENVHKLSLDDRLISVITNVTRNSKPSHQSDFAVLTYTNKHACHVVETLNRNRIRSVNVYDNDGERDPMKVFRFRKGDGRIKVCTGHSFKGFEMWGIILIIHKSQRDPIEQLRWIYMCMGRAIEGLWVLNCDPKLNDVADWFPNELPQ